MFLIVLKGAGDEMRLLFLRIFYCTVFLLEFNLYGEVERNLQNVALRQQKAAVMFCDIRDFTGLCENNSSEKIFAVLNAYFDGIVHIIIKYEGLIDKFMGDAVLALFIEDSLRGQTGQSNKHACVRAVKAAEEIESFVESFDLVPFKLKKETKTRFKNGIGLNFGDVTFGFLGSYARFEYTVIGDVVNVANRLQDFTKLPCACEKLGGNIIISQTVLDGLTEELKHKFISLGDFPIRGRREYVGVYGYGKR